MKFFRSLRAALHSDDFIGRFGQASVGNVFWFLFWLCAFQGLVMIIVAAISFGPSLAKFTAVSYIEDTYPGNLEVNIDRGQATTNVEEPYFIPLSGAGAATSTVKNLIVLDTHAENPLMAIETYQAGMLLAKDVLVVRENQDRGMRVISFRDIDGMHLNKQTAVEFARVVTAIVYVLIAVLLVTGPFIFGFFGAACSLVVLVGYALVTWLVAKARRLPVSYRQAYILSGYLLATPLLAGTIFSAFSMSAPLWFMIGLFLAVALVNIRLRKTGNPAPEKETEVESEQGEV